nr:triple gene block protein1 [Betaflexiviridae sp.]
MNKLCDLLVEFGFVRTKLAISRPLVIHAVPGAGKTTLLRTFLEDYPSAEVITGGEEDVKNLTGRRIRKAKVFNNCSNFCIIDEYITLSELIDCDALFSDPIQNNSEGLQAHYFKDITHRVPRAICNWLQTFGFKINSVVEGEIVLESFYGPDPVGKVIAFENSVIDLLRKHNCSFALPCEVRGLEFDVVTLFTEKDCSELIGFELYISATRAKRKLIVRTLDAHSITS